MGVFEYQTYLNCSVEGLFTFLSRPANVPLVTRPDIGIKFVSAPDEVSEGSRLEFQIVSFGQIIQATHQIIEFRRPHLVVEAQVTGPMKSWTHRHEYESTPGGVLAKDIIEFERPGGLVGLLVTEQKITDHLEDGMYYREQKLNELIAQGRLE